MVAAAQVGLGLATAALPWAGGLDAKRANAEADRVVSFIALQRDIGEGSVSTASDGRPAVAYALDSRDAASLCRGVGAAGAALAAAGASTVKTLHLVDPPTWRRGGDVSEWIAAVAKRGYASDNRSTLLSAHQMGSCRIGKDASASAFDATGESWELPGLFVADASAFPTASGVNPMVSRPARKKVPGLRTTMIPASTRRRHELNFSRKVTTMALARVVALGIGANPEGTDAGTRAARWRRWEAKRAARRAAAAAAVVAVVATGFAAARKR